MSTSSVVIEEDGKIVITLFDGRSYELDPEERRINWASRGLEARCEFLSMLMSRACWDSLILSNVGSILKPRIKKINEIKRRDLVQGAGKEEAGK